MPKPEPVLLPAFDQNIIFYSSNGKKYRKHVLIGWSALDTEKPQPILYPEKEPGHRVFAAFGLGANIEYMNHETGIYYPHFEAACRDGV